MTEENKKKIRPKIKTAAKQMREEIQAIKDSDIDFDFYKVISQMWHFNSIFAPTIQNNESVRAEQYLKDVAKTGEFAATLLKKIEALKDKQEKEQADNLKN